MRIWEVYQEAALNQSIEKKIQTFCYWMLEMYSKEHPILTTMVGNFELEIDEYDAMT